MTSTRVVMAIVLLLACTAAGAQLSRMIYWSDQAAGKIQRARLDKTAVQDVLTSEDGLGSPRGLGIDVATGNMYWVDSELGTVERANLDGTQREVIATGLSFGADLTLDVSRGFVYWSDADARTIKRKKIGGINIVFPVLTSDTDAPYYIALDEINNVIYWSDIDGSYIRRKSLALGSQPETVVSGLSQVRDIALDVEGGKIYWADRGSSKIQGMNLDGTGGIEDLFVGYEGLDRPHGLALDFGARKIYWTDTGTNSISRGNMDGSGAVERFATGLSGPWALAIMPTAADLDVDGRVDGRDYAMLAVRWGQDSCGAYNGWCGGADLTVDGVVGFDDMAQLASMWLAQR